ncbi:MAG: DinB family protein [Acidobacteriia bacterium]|nr:DinB family protein [Terriglobia bacterium]
MTTLRLLITLTTILFLTLPLAGQTQPTAPANPLTTDAREAWGFVKAMILRAAEKMPEENYAFKPVPEVRSFGQLITHIVLGQNGLCGVVKGVAHPNVELDKATKADLIAALKESDAYCDAAFEGLTDAQGAELLTLYGRSRARLTGLYMLSFHGREHYGNMVTYMRLKGLVPPSSEPRK